MTARKQAIIVPHGTGTAINPLETARINVPAAPWADGSPILADARPETAPARGVMSVEPKRKPSTADLFLAALREEVEDFRKGRAA